MGVASCLLNLYSLSKKKGEFISSTRSTGQKSAREVLPNLQGKGKASGKDARLGNPTHAAGKKLGLHQ